jgi:hypothetical protein
MVRNRLDRGRAVVWDGAVGAARSAALMRAVTEAGTSGAEA